MSGPATSPASAENVPPAPNLLLSPCDIAAAFVFNLFDLLYHNITHFIDVERFCQQIYGETD